MQRAGIGVKEQLGHFFDSHMLTVNTQSSYYACLSGHNQMAQFLLSRGARCDPDTFDGERCFYAALTHRFEDVLTLYGASEEVEDPYQAFTTRHAKGVVGGERNVAVTFVHVAQQSGIL